MGMNERTGLWLFASAMASLPALIFASLQLAA